MIDDPARAQLRERLEKQITRAEKAASAWDPGGPFDHGKLDYNCWPDDAVMATEWLPEFIAVMREALARLGEPEAPATKVGCTSQYHAWEGPPVGTMWEPEPSQRCMCPMRVTWRDREAIQQVGYKTVRPLGEPEAAPKASRWGQCGSCGGTHFQVIERCTNCNDVEILEQFKTTGDVPKPAESPVLAREPEQHRHPPYDDCGPDCLVNPLKVDDLEWAIERISRKAEIDRHNAAFYAEKLLKGYGYPDSVMHDAQDALAFEIVLAALKWPVKPISAAHPKQVIVTDTVTGVQQEFVTGIPDVSVVQLKNPSRWAWIITDQYNQKWQITSTGNVDNPWKVERIQE